ncbi:hypothetical protein V865_001582 [Kwoniella europaea PYCC6329]|uniref:Endoplasmic reticulum-based factor for assembly of V-ATPase n=1 Tax=Kwoniella europaea PYCC6329 TaxID=1423913 RepID=A0AAX4KC49_9TREE
MTTLLILPPHLIETIQELLKSDVDLPEELRGELDRATSNRFDEYHLAGVSDDDPKGDTGDLSALTVKDTLLQRTVPHQTIEELSRWAGSDQGIEQLEKNGLDPSKYNTISLLAGTEIHIPPNELDRLKLAESGNKPNPYLPSYLSPSTSNSSSIGKEFRNLSKTISTVLNILFSIFGSSIAVYVVSTSSAGYSKEISILLGILTGIIVGVADMVLVYLYTRKLDEGRRESKKVGLKMLRGSGKIGEKDEGEKDSSGDGEKEDESVVDLSQTSDTLSTAVKKEVRLRRRGLNENT